MNAQPMWECGACGEVYDTPTDARACCAPDSNQFWHCLECDTEWETESKAEACCAGEAPTFR